MSDLQKNFSFYIEKYEQLQRLEKPSIYEWWQAHEPPGTSVSVPELMNLQKLRDFCLQDYDQLQRRIKPGLIAGAPDLVLGLAANLGRKEIEVFINSLRRSGYCDEIALVVTTLDEEMEKYCRANAVTLIRAGIASAFTSPCLLRFYIYYDFLINRLLAGHAYRKIFLSDVSDVLFQKNPFSVDVPDTLILFSESCVNIGECPANRGWIYYGFGADAIEKLSHKNVFCSGTISGPLYNILDYILKMMLVSTGINDYALHFLGIDQGIHNYMIYKDWLPGSFHSQNGDIVLTMHYYIKKGGVIYKNSKNQICLQNGHVPAVIHQYNRIKDLVDVVRNQYKEGATRK